MRHEQLTRRRYGQPLTTAAVRTVPPGQPSRLWVALRSRTVSVLGARSKLDDMAYEIPVTQARAELADLINRVVYGGERVVVTRHGKPLVALVSAADLERLEALGEPEDEQVISSVSGIGSTPSTGGDRHRFGIAAEHRGPEVR